MALNERRTDVEPDWRIVKIDETHFWDEDSKARSLGKKLVSTYAYNRNSETYCCSLTPAYWLLYLGTEAQTNEDLTDDELEMIDAELRESECDEQSAYYNCSDVDKWDSQPMTYSIDVDREDFGDDEEGDRAYDMAVEDAIRESFQANPC